MSRRILNSRGASWPRATASATTAFRIRCSTAWRPAKAEAEIDRGIAEDEFALYGRRRTDPTTPFFRFPGFASNGVLLDWLQGRHIVVFGADVWASDWLPMTPAEELQLILSRIERIGSGIVLLHDIKAQTAAMLPAFLRELKRRGYRIVHVVPAGNGGNPH